MTRVSMMTLGWLVALAPTTLAAGVKADGEAGRFLARYCLGCHSAKEIKGGLDLERFTTTDDLRKDLKAWETVLEQLDGGEMPPKEKPQPSPEERQRFVAWVRGVLDGEARAHAGDPGHVPLRRLSNASTTPRSAT